MDEQINEQGEQFHAPPPDDDTYLTQEELDYKTMDEIPRRMEDIKIGLEEKTGLGRSFDLVLREMTFAGKRTAMFYVNGLVKDTALNEVLERLTFANAEEMRPDALMSFFHRLIPHIQVDKVSTFSEAVNQALAGSTALFIESEQQALIIDAKSFPSRGVEEPSLERVVRGSRDGFVETLMQNAGLLRRRLRDPRLKLEITKVGKRSQTDVCIGYIQDIADMDLVSSIKRKLDSVSVDGLPMAEKQLEELMVGRGWNPYPMVRYTERPDVAAVHLLEGHVLVMVDTSPSAMILPATFFHMVQHAEEYRQTPFMGTYLRWVRYFGIFASMFMLPLWFLFVTNTHLLPPNLEFIGPQKTGELPILLQFLFAEIGVDLMRMAAVHTPTPLATAMGLIAAILIGDIAVQTGLFVNEVILYMAVAAIGMFATPSYELGLANRATRLILLIAVALFQVPGLVVGTTALIIVLAVQRSYNSPYLWPFIPFDWQGMRQLIVRRPIQTMDKRLSLTKTVDSTRQRKD